MAIKTFDFEGTFKWAKFQSPDKKYNDYRCSFYPKDDATRKAIKATGTKASPKEDDDGWFYTFKSDDKPPVIDKEGNEITDLIGNGSRGFLRLKVEDFESKKWGKVVRTRIDKVLLTDFIKYDPPTREGEFEAALQQRGQEAKAAAEAEQSSDMPW